MKTYQDLMSVNESEIGKFCISAIQDFMSTQEYKASKEGEAYYNKHNTTIEAFQKFIYTLTGNRVVDIYSANYKLKTLFFRRLVTQQVQYVLGNGLTLQESENKQKLGRDFDFQLQKAAKRAMSSGQAFGFWNYDHLEVFGYADTNHDPGFCPLYDEETAELAAGIRYWFKRVGNKTLTRFTLYEADGYTEYCKNIEDEIEVVQEKRKYKTITTSLQGQIIVDSVGENYNRLPIVPLYANDAHESELVGIRESIDCYDLIKSGLADNIDDSSEIFWLLKNTGGMDDIELAKFLQRIKTVHGAVVDGEGDGNASAEAHTMQIPTEARRTMLELLRSDIYEDFQALDVKTLSAAAKTTQEIQAAYQSQDNKCADFEYLVIDFVQQILSLAGIDDEPSFTWNRVVNIQEQTNTILSAANYLDDETLIKKLPFLTP
ncbi:MAG: phage portal protein, partial [Bacteroidales bacterium]|nr:phage portal protein [Candidatus Minthousia equi]